MPTHPRGTSERHSRALGDRTVIAAVARRSRSALLWVILVAILLPPSVMLLWIGFGSGDPSVLPPTAIGLAGPLSGLANLEWFRNTLIFAVGTAVLATSLGTVLAIIMARTNIRGKRVLGLLIILPYPMGAMVSVVAWSALGSKKQGLINQIASLVVGHDVSIINIYSVVGVIVVEGLFQTPLAYLLIEAAARNLSSSLEESAMISGSGRLRALLKIDVALLRPSIIGSALFVFVATLGAFAVPSVLGASSHFTVATEAVYLNVNSFTPNYRVAASVGIILVLIALVVVRLSSAYLRKRSHATVSGKGGDSRPLMLRGLTWPVYIFTYGYLLIAVVLPLGGLVFASLQLNERLRITDPSFTLRNYHYVLFDYPPIRQAIGHSLLLGLVTAVCGVALASAVALLVERKRRRGRSGAGLEMVVMSPQAIPHLIFGFALLIFALVLPLGIYGTLVPLLFAYVVIFLPLAYRGMAGVVSQVDRTLPEAARIAGASEGRATRTITLPILKPSLIASGSLLFILCLSEVSASIMLSNTQSRVLGPMMYNFYDSGGLTLVSALAIVQICIVGVVVMLIRKVSGRWLTI
jgi:iron(III) transport system permease protein